VAGRAPRGSPAKSSMMSQVRAVSVATPASSTGTTARRSGVLARNQCQTSFPITKMMRRPPRTRWRLSLDYSPVAAKTRQRPQNGPAAPRSGGQRLARATSGPIGSYEGPCRCRRGLKSRCAGVKSRCAGASEQVAVRDRDEQSGAGPAQVANERPARRSNALASCFAQGQAASRRKKVRRPVRTRRPAVCRAQ